MGKFIANRVVSMVITLLLVITITFFLMHAIPGGPFTREKTLPPAVIKALEAKYNLDQPLWKQYVDYLGGVIRFDLGPSFQKIGVSVNEMIEKGFPISARVGGLASLFVLVVGIPMGMISALKQNKWQDQLAMFIATLGVTIPMFVVAKIGRASCRERV